MVRRYSRITSLGFGLCFAFVALILPQSAHAQALDIDQPEMAPILTLGAGDALGWRIYQQDVVLAMRDGYSRGVYQPQIFPDMDVRVVEVPID